MKADVSPLLSSVSLMLAAFGFFYGTQRERIDAAIDDTTLPDAGSTKRKNLLKSTKRIRGSAAWLAIAALIVWILLLDEIEDRVGAVLDDHSLASYSTPDAIFFVAANAWLLVATYIASRWLKLCKRVDKLS